MAQTNLPLQRTTLPLSTGDFPFPGILCPSVHKGQNSHSTYIIPRGESGASSLRIDLKETAQRAGSNLKAARRTLALPSDEFPYGLTEAQWWEYALAPHNYLDLGSGVYQIGLNYFHRFLHLDTRQMKACLFDPGIGQNFLSSTNHYDPVADELWFASWTVEDTFKRNRNPLSPVTVTVWNYSFSRGQKNRIWRGSLGDSLHQLAVTPDGRFLILAELGLRALGPGELAHSTVLVLNLKTLQEWRIELPTAAHIEFDPEDPTVCYLSAHHIGLVGPKVGIYGPGAIHKIRLTPDGPAMLGFFSCPDFYRITTHIVFQQRAKTLIAVSGYPGDVFLIDAATLRLEKVIKMDATDRVDPTNLPHLCTQDSYGIASSEDGNYLLVCKTGRIMVLDAITGEVISSKTIEECGENSCFTGHLGRISNSTGVSR